jgi:hypothetical protein
MEEHRMSTETNTTNTDATTPEGTPDYPADLGDAGKKALDAERRARTAAENQTATLRARLAAIETAQLSDLDKAKKAADDAMSDATAARAEALRYRIATRFQVTDEDAELFLTGTDEETLTRQAERLVARNKPGTPKPDHSQGARGSTAPQTSGELFAAAVEGSFTR